MEHMSSRLCSGLRGNEHMCIYMHTQILILLPIHVLLEGISKITGEASLRFVAHFYMRL